MNGDLDNISVISEAKLKKIYCDVPPESRDIGALIVS
jgi:hypothetical protein